MFGTAAVGYSSTRRTNTRTLPAAAADRPSHHQCRQRPVTTGSAFSYSITATNSPTSYNASGLPSGLSVNTSNGVISGTPATAGSYSVTISATNSAGTGSATLSLTISQAPPAATSTTSSTSAPASAGSSSNASGAGSATSALNVTNQLYGGAYFGTANANAGAASESWALYVQPDNSAVFIGYLGGNATVANLTINADGTFNLQVEPGNRAYPG